MANSFRKFKNSVLNSFPLILLYFLSISEIDAVRRHFQQCWNIPSGAREAGDLATEIKVRFQFIDKEVELESWSELIHLDGQKNFKQVRFSTRLDYVPALEKKKLEKFYKARRLFSKLCSSKKFELKFKLKAGDLIMFDNYRTLHGRTAFDLKEGKRFLKGCYIDHDSTEGKLRYLERKFDLKWKK